MSTAPTPPDRSAASPARSLASASAPPPPPGDEDADAAGPDHLLRRRPWRVGVVDYVNTLPLIDGLQQVRDLDLRHAVPSRLVGMLLADEVDVALCSIIDYQLSPVPLQIVPAGMLGCDGTTMTVRLFSQVPIRKIRRIHADTDSHTSVVLLRILLARLHQVHAELIPFDAQTAMVGGATAAGHAEDIAWPEAMLLIGDKVVTNATPAIRYPFQMDLGAEWHDWTGLPFVFATWLTRRDRPAFPDAAVDAVAAVLDRQRRHNLERLEHILSRRLTDRRWPIDLARSYLFDMLRYAFDERARAGAERFFDEAHDLGLIPERRPTEFAGLPAPALANGIAGASGPACREG